MRIGDSLYSYDADGNATGLVHRGPAYELLEEYAYTYDLAGRMTSRTLDAVPMTFSYDVVNQVLGDGTTTLVYDATGNRDNGSKYQYTTGNRLTTDGLWTYTYDAVGNITKKSQGPSAETWTYSYDHNNQMVNASKYATDGGTYLGGVTYTYDVFGNRLSRVGTDTGEERYGYDGWDTAKDNAIGAENFDAWADLDNTNALTMRRVYDAGFDNLGMRIDPAGTLTAWYLNDIQGSVTQAHDDTGVFIDWRRYDAFGNITDQKADYGSADRYAYAGREWDTFTGLQYNRARMYDPQIGRWYSADPMGFDAGDVNLYRYVGNGYVNATDPSGYFYSYLSNLAQRAVRKIFDEKHRVTKAVDVMAGIARGTDVLRRVVSDPIIDSAINIRKSYIDGGLGAAADAYAMAMFKNHPIYGLAWKMGEDTLGNWARGNNLVESYLYSFAKNTPGLPSIIWRFVEGIAGEQYGGLHHRDKLALDERAFRMTSSLYDLGLSVLPVFAGKVGLRSNASPSMRSPRKPLDHRRVNPRTGLTIDEEVRNAMDPGRPGPHNRTIAVPRMRGANAPAAPPARTQMDWQLPINEGGAVNAIGRVGGTEIEIIAGMRRVGNAIHLDGVHFTKNAGGRLGPKQLEEYGRDFLRQHGNGATELVIHPAPRTTGATAGTGVPPKDITIKLE